MLEKAFLIIAVIEILIPPTLVDPGSIANLSHLAKVFDIIDTSH